MAHHTEDKYHRQVFVVPFLWQCQQAIGTVGSQKTDSYPYYISVLLRKLEALKSDNVN